MPRTVHNQPAMTAHEFRAIRAGLGLTQEQLAPMLGYAPKRVTVAMLELDTSNARAIPPAIARLMRAYRDGYRPADWPV